MAKSLDVAVAFLEKSIELGKKDSRYYMDFVKLHKLMYLGQCFISSKFDMDLFEESVVADQSGPYIKGIGLITGYCGFSEIYDITKLKDKALDMPLSYTRNETINLILERYGKLTTDQIVMFCKQTYAYKQYEGLYDGDFEICKQFIKISGEQIFEDICTKSGFIRYKCPNYCIYQQDCIKIKKKTL